MKASSPSSPTSSSREASVLICDSFPPFSTAGRSLVPFFLTCKSLSLLISLLLPLPLPSLRWLNLAGVPDFGVSRGGSTTVCIMAFNGVVHQLATLRHFCDNLPEGASSLGDLSPRRSIQSGPEIGFRQLHKVEGRSDLHRRPSDLDTKGPAGDRVSLLCDAGSSMKIEDPIWLSDDTVTPRYASSFAQGHEETNPVCLPSRSSHPQKQPSTRNRDTSVVNKALALNTQWTCIPTTMANKVPEPAGSHIDFGAEDVASDSIIALSAQQRHGFAGRVPFSEQRAALRAFLQSDTSAGNKLVEAGTEEQKLRQASCLKADIVTHPLYDQLLAAHVACLRIATPADQIPEINTQLDQSSHVAAKYSALGQSHPTDAKDELDHFMANYILLLCSFKEQLQHLRTQARDAAIACCELERNFVDLTGFSPGEGTGGTMSDDDHSDADDDPYLCDMFVDGHDTGGLGPLIPTETEHSLMERVREELKAALKQGYKDRILDVREEILRKRRAGKLPGDTTSVLKSWWHAHSKWPYPTEDEKARLVEETGLQLKQINNWFINQRKRNWHANSSSSSSSASSLKPKRRR